MYIITRRQFYHVSDTTLVHSRQVTLHCPIPTVDEHTAKTCIGLQYLE